MNIQEKIKQCENHGFKVKQVGTWLWLTGTDGRYKKQKGDYILLDQETKVLFALGFKYSKSRGQYYWDGTDYNTLYEQAKKKTDQIKAEIEELEKQKKQRADMIIELFKQGKHEEAQKIFDNTNEVDNIEKHIKLLQRKLTEAQKEVNKYLARIKAAENI